MASSNRDNQSIKTTSESLMNLLDKYRKMPDDRKAQSKLIAGVGVIENIINADSDPNKIKIILQDAFKNPIIKNDKEFVAKLRDLETAYAREASPNNPNPFTSASMASAASPKKTSLPGLAKLNDTLNKVNQTWQDKVNAPKPALPITSNDARVQNLHNVFREIQVAEKSYVDSIKWLVSMVDTHTKELRTNMSAESHKKFEEFMQPYRIIAGSPNPILAKKSDGTNVNDMIDLIKKIQGNVQLDNPLAKAGINVNFTLTDFQKFLEQHKLTAFGAHISKPMQHSMRYSMLVDQVAGSLDKIKNEGNEYLITPYPEKIKTLKQTVDSAVVATRFLPKLINKGHELGQHHVFSSAAIQASVHKEVLTTFQKENAAKANDASKINPPKMPEKKAESSNVKPDIKQMPKAAAAAGSGAHRRIDPKQDKAHDLKGKAPKNPIPSSSMADGIARAPVKGASLLTKPLPSTPWSIPTTPPPAPPTNGAAPLPKTPGRRPTVPIRELPTPNMKQPADFISKKPVPTPPKPVAKVADPEALRKSLAGNNLQQQSEIYKRKQAVEQNRQQTDVKKHPSVNRRGMNK